MKTLWLRFEKRVQELSRASYLAIQLCLIVFWLSTLLIPFLYRNFFQ